ncbi:acetyl-CoA carboxylase biotin carboxyl carrier protein [Amycolatopsis sp. lyj-90]|uniref:acetyl-CoA carboxylase biotin carboxyl carrier protein n=1 Tax=Amycolatopsis sp. lyj-90 TaxID=2789285 RepID=UPI00397A00CB
MTKLDAESAMEVLCRGLSGIVGATPHSPRRVRVRLGCASIDVEWPLDPAAPTEVPLIEEGTPAGHEIRAPLVGTFYRSTRPGAKPFVSEGDIVEVGQQVAIVEAMKLMNPLVADEAGRVERILVDDAEAVEYGQPLLILAAETAE